ncbi:MAG: DUF11 domain-containing protein, partial [Limisphaerales bacterium]
SLPTVGGNTIGVTAGGVLNWNTVGGTSGQKFAVQVIIEENRAGNTTGTNGRGPLDFIIELAGSVTNLPPTVTGTNGSITIGPNQTFTATFVGTDPEGGPLRVNHQGLPPGATLTPADGTTNASPTSVVFSWTPAPADVGNSYAVGAFNLAGVTASVGSVVGPSGITDSVDADDGVVDGNGNGGHSYFVTGTNAVVFTFNPLVLGRLPTKVGIVLTDGDPTGSGIEAFDTNGVSLGVIGLFEIGDNSVSGETAEDRFLGVEFAGGISALRVYYASPGFELDHLQFDIPTTDLQLTGTAPTGATAAASFTVTLAVTNLGPNAVTSAMVTNAAPGPVTINSVVATAGAFDPLTGRWNVGPLAVGVGATLTFTFTPTNSGQVQLQSRVVSNVPDRNPANNTVTHTVIVTNLAPTLTFASAVVGSWRTPARRTSQPSPPPRRWSQGKASPTASRQWP